MVILGISAYYHDAAAALVMDGEIVAAAQEERFTRRKFDAAFPSHAIRYCLEESGYTMEELDTVVFYDKPFLKFERLLETYYHFAPRGLTSFVTAIPVWVKEKLFLKGLLIKQLKKIGAFDPGKTPLLFSEHHLSHAASAFFASPFDQAAILTIDGVGEWSTASVSRGKGNTIRILQEMHFPHSVGLLYSAFTYYLGFRVNSGEYKLMGLAPYGIPDDRQTMEFQDIIRNKLVSVKEDGSIWLNPSMFSYATGLRMVPSRKWKRLFGFGRRLPSDPVGQHHCNLAFAIQEITEEIVLRMAKHTLQQTGLKNLCLAGGVALNCVANGKLLREKITGNMFIQPAAGDAGGALGAALAGYHVYHGCARQPVLPDSMKGALLGPSYEEQRIRATLRRAGAPFTHYPDFNDLAQRVATLIAEGKVVGWFQGRMEYGPRALGNRSILGDARKEEMQKNLKLTIKSRESFRPFAPATLEEDARSCYELNVPSPYMLLVAKVKKERRRTLPENYFGLPPMERLYVQRSDVPAITHIDFSARIQTVSRETNERFWTLLQAFKEQTGSATLINTSFNVRGEPIVNTPEEAYRCFMNTGMDALVLENFLLLKDQQPEWKEDDYTKQLKPD